MAPKPMTCQSTLDVSKSVVQVSTLNARILKNKESPHKRALIFCLQYFKLYHQRPNCSYKQKHKLTQSEIQW